ncbi:50S ribosomal protein L6 [Neiella marina]|uniref:Large ribosomal subunit protein uL6 n=1 Tax=Neiella marina TaxID=508461 RepID=A0A8J2UAN9_9GAMM|nr:50S ribosomal protein L6 [Neiella marina]GGA90112.1 50S ribosomal protein L6 [Neiella marina]
MSRVAKAPVQIPAGVEVTLKGQDLTIKGGQGTLSRTIHAGVEVKQEENALTFAGREGVDGAWAQAGTARALVNNMVTGVSQGFVRKLLLNGVGYRAQVKGKVVNLALGLSHPVDHELPEGVTAECPSQTEIVLKGVDKQLVGQVAANIRAYRKPEPYKGKGIRYDDEHVRRKEAKKK